MDCINRRKFLQIATLGPLVSVNALNMPGCNRQRGRGLIQRIESSIIWPGRTEGKTWFHPRACMIPSRPNPVALMTCQTISGSDVFSQVYWSSSSDIGDGVNDPDHVARMGNFHVVNASRNESWVTVGETLPHENWRGNTMLGRIFWNRANELVDF